MLFIGIMLGVNNLITIVKAFVDSKVEKRRLEKFEEAMYNLGDVISDEVIDKMEVIVYEKGTVEDEERLKFGDE